MVPDVSFRQLMLEEDALSQLKKKLGTYRDPYAPHLACRTTHTSDRKNRMSIGEV